jgi:hypothetical protein
MPVLSATTGSRPPSALGNLCGCVLTPASNAFVVVTRATPERLPGPSASLVDVQRVATPWRLTRPSIARTSPRRASPQTRYLGSSALERPHSARIEWVTATSTPPVQAATSTTSKPTSTEAQQPGQADDTQEQAQQPSQPLVLATLTSERVRVSQVGVRCAVKAGERVRCSWSEGRSR